MLALFKTQFIQIREFTKTFYRFKLKRRRNETLNLFIKINKPFSTIKWFPLRFCLSCFAAFLKRRTYSLIANRSRCLICKAKKKQPMEPVTVYAFICFRLELVNFHT